MQSEDTEERYHQHVAYLISRSKSRGGTGYFNQFVNRCRDEAAAAYPRGAAAARKKDTAADGLLGVLGVPNFRQRVGARPPSPRFALGRQRLALFDPSGASLAEPGSRGGRHLRHLVAVFLVLVQLVVRDPLAGHSAHSQNFF